MVNEPDSADRRLLGPILGPQGSPPLLLADVLAKQLARRRAQDPNMQHVPLNVKSATDQARRHVVGGAGDFHCTVEVNGSHAVLVVAEGLDG